MRREQLSRRLAMYWQFELANVVLVPGAAVGLCVATGEPVGWLGVVCLVPTALLLVIGGFYWWGKARQLERRPELLDRTLRAAARLQYPVLALTVGAVALCTLDAFGAGLSAGLGDRVVAWFGAVLAALEYVNYYHRQLQHFDHLPDFVRLLQGRGFRKSQLRTDLDQLRGRAS